jgi:hypothetical protein
VLELDPVTINYILIVPIVASAVIAELAALGVEPAR